MPRTGNSEVQGQPLWNEFVQLKMTETNKEKQKGTVRTRRVSNDGGSSVNGRRALGCPQSVTDGAAMARLAIATLMIVSSAKSKSPNSNKL